jgi:hypothetical protein
LIYKSDAITGIISWLSVTTFIVALLVFIASLAYFNTNPSVDARCPNGYHKSPSGDCEAVVPHSGLPRCPNGYHKSPSGDCEAVSSSSTSSGKSDYNNSISSSVGTSPSTNGCDQSLWNHVYNPSRLKIIDPCKTVSGVIESIRSERDGDFHIRLKLDPEFSNLINSANINGQFGDLVLEPICINPVTQADAISACQNFHQHINISPVGTHVKVSASYVLDKQHNGWAEIHPVTSITPIR